jgi:DNA-binding CsgD family transcriptional regulator
VAGTDIGEADRWYDLALTTHAASPDPFELARTRLAYGRTLREAGAAQEATQQLKQALQAFTTLGADPWSDFTDTQLDLLILPPSWDGPRLNSQERRVLRLAAAGATDDQICETLGITPRSVDHDLRRICDKLGVSRRSELAGLLKQPRTAAQPTKPA